MRAQQELTVYDGTASSSNIPAYISYFDDFAKSQVVIPAADLSEMSGGTISSMKFYVNSSTSDANIPYTTASTVDVYLMEVDYTSISAYEPKENGTIVYNGTLDVVSGAKDDKGSLTINFSTPYSYNGGNLLIGIENTNDLGYKFIYFTGTQVEGASIAGSNGSATGTIPATQRNFIPKTTFTYTTGGGNPDLPDPEDIPDEYFYISASGWAMWQGAPASYPGQDECEIDAIDITGFVEPAMGSAPQSDFTTAGDNYTISSVDWYESTSMDPMSADEYFETGLSYYMIVTVTPNEGCTFSPNCTVNINGNTSYIDETNTSVAEDAIVITTIDFDITEITDECVIDLVDVSGFTAPAFGATVSYDGLYSTSENLVVSSAAWYNYTSDDPLEEGDTFGEDTYYLYVEFEPTGDCESAGSITYSVNGQDGIADEEYCGYDSDSDVYYIYTIDYELTDPGDDPQPMADIIDFETGDLSQASFTMDATYPWTVTNADNHTDGGTYCMKSGNDGVNSSTSEMILEVEVEEVKNLSFWYKVSSESGWDKCYFSIDGTNKLGGESGNGNWTNITATLTAGTHTLRWYYTKDSSGASNDDCFYVDDIEIIDYQETPFVAATFPIDFEDGTLGGLIAIDNDADGNTWTAYNGYAHGGSYCARVKYNSSGCDDYLIIPVTPESGDVLSFYAASYSSTYLESFDVRVSTTDAEPSSFTTIASYTDAPYYSNGYQNYTADLSDYAGQDIYVAIRCNSVDKFYFQVDDIDLVSAKKADAKKGFKNLTGKTIASNMKQNVLKANRMIKLNPVYEFGKRNAWGVKGNRNIVWNFDDSSFGEWTTIDADGDGYNWVLGSAVGGVYLATGASLAGNGHDSSADLVVSGSYTNVSSSALTPDNYLVSPLLSIDENNNVFSFWACGQDAGYCAEHFGVAVSTTSNTDAGAFTMLQEWDMTAKGNVTAKKGAPRGESKDQGTWYQYLVDLSQYVGQDVYVAIRHFDCTDQFMLDVDDVELATADMFVGYNVYLDGQLVAEGVTETEYYMQAAEEFSDGSEHTTSLEAVYASGNKLAVTKAWTYQSGDHFPGSPEGLDVTFNGTEANLSWSMPELEPEMININYPFDDENYEGLSILDNNSDQTTWGLTNGMGVDGGVCAYIAYADANDDYLLMPAVTPSASSVFSFDATCYNSSYPETFEVVVGPATGTIDELTVIATETISSTDYASYSYPLGEYAGQEVYVAIHNISEDMYYMFVDNLAINDVMVAKSEIGAVVYRDNEIIAKLRNGETSYTDNEGSENAEYCIRIIQNGEMSDGVYYALAEKQCVEQIVYECVAPVELAAEIDSNSVILTWNMDADLIVNGYTIYRSTDGEEYEIIAQGVTEMTYTDENLDYGTYYYQVTANNTLPDQTTCESEPALATNGTDDFVVVEISEIEPETCQAPYDLAATLVENDVTLTWEYDVEPAEGSIIYDFEADFTAQQITEWTTIDADGDGNDWYVRPTALTSLGHNDSEGFVTSASYAGSALTPDNYLVSPQVTISEENYMFSFWACAQDASWPQEHFGVAVSTTGNTDASAFTTIQEWTMTAKSMAKKNAVAAVSSMESRSGNRAIGAWYEYTVDLSDYMGQSIYVAIRHFDCTDWFRLNVDDIMFSGEPVEDNTTFTVYRSTDGETYEIIAENVNEMTYTDEDLDYGTYYYQVTASSVLSDGTDCESDPALDVNEENDYVMVELIEPTYECIAAINLDATVDGGSAILTWEMPTGESYEYDFEGGLNGWTTFEGADAETTWIHSDNNLGGYDYTTHAHSGTGFAMSYSFVDNVSAYQADNYLVSPVKYSIENGTTMTFFYDFANESYADFFAVEVSTGSNNTAADFTEVWSTDGKKANGGNAIVRKVNGTRYDNWQEATIDLSAFAGQEVWIAFHHEDYDMYEVWIDDVTVGAGASAPLFNIYRSTDGENYELIAEGVEEMNYTDTGLSDGTYYYQVTSVLYDYDGEVACESDPALAVNGEDDFVMVTIDGIEDFSSLINVYPNPTKANVNIEAEGLNNIVVFNALGQVVYEVNATDDHVVVNMSNFGAGVYMFNIVTNNGTTVKRVTVAK